MLKWLLITDCKLSNKSCYCICVMINCCKYKVMCKCCCNLQVSIQRFTGKKDENSLYLISKWQVGEDWQVLCPFDRHEEQSSSGLIYAFRARIGIESCVALWRACLRLITCYINVLIHCRDRKKEHNNAVNYRRHTLVIVNPLPEQNSNCTQKIIT